jgi:gluconate 5-dehydrogenase
MVDDVVRHFGRLDILVNCVGLNREEKAEEATEEMFDHVVDVNLKGAMFQAQAAARHMIRQGEGGKQVHIGSVRTLLALRGRGYAAYCASKGGLAILCKQLAAEWAAAQHQRERRRADVRPHAASSPHAVGSAVLRHASVARIPLGTDRRTGGRLERCAVFVSSASDFVTGQTLYLDAASRRRSSVVRAHPPVDCPSTDAVPIAIATKARTRKRSRGVS